MDKAIEFLYTKFIYRDVLGYGLPGAIAVLSILWAFSFDVTQRSEKKAYLVAFVFVAYAAGLSLQALGTFWYEKHSWPILSLYPIEPLSQSETAFAEQDRKFNKRGIAAIPPANRPDATATRLERFAGLKQIYGNLAMSLLIVAIAILIRAYRLFPGNNRRQWLVWHIGISFGAVLLALVLLHEHKKLVLKEYVYQKLLADLSNDPLVSASAAPATQPSTRTAAMP